MARKFIFLSALVAAILALGAPAWAAPVGMDGTYRMGVDKRAAARDTLAHREAVRRAPARPPVRADVLGNTQSFFAYNFSTGQYFTVPATLRKVGGHCYVYVENAQWNANVSQNDVEKIASEFDGRIYPTTTAHFGSEWNPGIDGDTRITILVMDIRDNYLTASTYFTGYYSFLDEMPDIAAQQPPHRGRSNEREMFYMDCFPARAASDAFIQTIAHEFQHMIHWHQNPNEEEWVDEGCSDLSTYLNGFGVNADHFDAFYRNPLKPLLPFDGTLESYGVAFSFIYYLFDKYGGTTDIERKNFVRKLVASGTSGRDSIYVALSHAGFPDVTFNDVYKDFCTMLYLDMKGVPKFSVSAFDFSVEPTFTHSGYPVRDRSWQVEPWSRQYVLFENGSGEARVLKFLGADTGHFAVRLVQFNKDGTIATNDLNLNADADTFFDLYNLGRTYTRCMMIVMYLGDAGPNAFRYNVGYAGPTSAIYPNPIFVDSVNVTVKSFIPPQVTVRRLGGVEDKVKMKMLAKGLWTGNWYVPQSGVFDVEVYGEDEEGLSGTILSQFEVRKLRRQILNMIAYDGRSGRVNLALGRGSAAEGTLYVQDPPATLAGRVEAAGLEYVAGVDLSFAGSGAPADATIGFPAPQGARAGIVALEGERLRYVGSAREGEELVGDLAGFTPHAVAIDRVPPEILAARREGRLLLLELSDAGFGIDPARVNVRADGIERAARQLSATTFAVDDDAREGPVEIECADRAGNVATRTLAPARAAAFSDAQVAPNPATTAMRVEFGRPGDYAVRIFDAGGRAVRTAQASGAAWVWDLSNEAGRAVGNGVYLLEIRDRASGATERRKAAVLR